MRLLPEKTIRAIFAAAELQEFSDQRQFDAVRQWLSRAFYEEAERSTKQKLSKDDVRRFWDAYKPFQEIVEELKSRDYPPPLMELTNNEINNIWEWWFFQNINRLKRGRPEKYNWNLISHLLIIYEYDGLKKAKPWTENGETIKFLRTSLNILSDISERGFGSNFHPPKFEALRKRLPDLRKFSMKFYRMKLHNLYIEESP